MLLALAHYLGQEPVSNTAMLARVASVAPDVLVRAVRCSGLVLKQHSPRRTELDQVAATQPIIADETPGSMQPAPCVRRGSNCNARCLPYIRLWTLLLNWRETLD